ncbi:MAG: alcohol dehydrogenase catalytic domain-containing protein [Gracilibacteraceae bacterium]|jgi:2-desacetyl-2-hydroxyethyl bacteriochlorophyllide A dehydrogenase|nr:alcohol dehydrogenase catalytic domain-containing protein [Gracilibacteraceae bacterium]
MKAIKIVDVKKVEVRAVPDLAPNGRDVLIQVKASGICGSDLMFFRNGGFIGDQGTSTKTPGHEFCGVVVDPGASRTLKKGDRVVIMELNPCGECDLCKAGRINLCMQTLLVSYGCNENGFDGGMAEYCLVRPDMVVKIPDSLSDIQGALVEPAAIAMHAVLRSEVDAKSKVLVTGAGPIGLLCAAVARAMGAAQIVMTEISADRIKFARECNYADAVLNGADADLKDKLLEISGGSFSHVLECTGVGAVAAVAMDLLGWAGHFQMVAIHGSFELNMETTSMKEIDVRGGFYFEPEGFQKVIDLMAAGRLNLDKLVTRVAKLEEAQSCFESLDAGSDAKIVFVP